MGSDQQPQREHGGVPEEFRRRDQWIVTSDKKPIKPSEGWNERHQQLSYREAQEQAYNESHELAFVLAAEDPFAVIDLDYVGSPEMHSEEVCKIVDDLDTYAEISRSGTGLHLVCRGALLPTCSSKGALPSGGHIEAYDSDQYIVLTGNRLPIADGITVGGEEFEEIQRRYLCSVNPDGQPTESTDTSEFSDTDPDISLSVAQVRRTVEAYAKGGSKEATRTKRLWENSGSGGYSSKSEADLAFCSDLAFWCREDAKLIDQCVRDSRRYRSKWDEVHYSDGRTYGQGTIQQAIRSNLDTFSGRHVQVG